MRKVRTVCGSGVGAMLAAIVLAACGTASPTMPVAKASPAAPSAEPSQTPVDVRLVISDYLGSEVRLASLDAKDVASTKGAYDGVAGGQVIVLDGQSLKALSHSGTVTKLGQLAGVPSWTGPGTVAVKPDLSQWIYTLHGDDFISNIHLGSAASDRVIATIPPPQDGFFYQPFAWNSSGIYMVMQATGLGGAHPFLEYHFKLARIELATGRVTDVSPACRVYEVLDDGTMLCGQLEQGRMEIRFASGSSSVIQVTKSADATNYDGSFMAVVLSTDHKRLIATRNGASGAVVNYQMAAADLTAASASAFGPLDFVPETWLPDGRVVAYHQCLNGAVGWGGGPCDTKLDGTYFFSSDGTSHTLFYKTVRGNVVGWV